MERVGEHRVAGAAFRGFGRSRYLPFGAELRGLRVVNNLTEVRRAVRDDCPALPGVYGVLDARGELAYVGMSTALRKRLITYFQTGSAIRKEQAIAAHAD